MDPPSDVGAPHRGSSHPTAGAAPASYDPLLPSPSATPHPSAIPHPVVNPNAIPMDAPSETPHDLFCLAKEYQRRARIQDAANLYLKAAMNGHLSAMVCYATHLIPTDERAAFVWFRAAAERGDPRAWYELGQLLARGRYFEVNAVDAARCWKRAAQMGDNTGKSALGLCYIRGFGVKQDLDKGVEIVKQVADVHNDVTAMKNLAWIFRYGKGVPKNIQEAEYWENRATEQEKIMNHTASREQVLFGRSRSSRSSKHRTRDSEKSSSRPTTRESSLSERATTPDSGTRRSKSRDSSARPSFQQVAVDELEGRLRQVSEQQKSQVARSISPHGHIPYIPVRSISPNPVRGKDFSESHTGVTVNPQHESANPPSACDDSRHSHSPASTSRPSRSSISDAVAGRPHVDFYERDSKVQRQPDPVLGAAVANLSFVERSPEAGSSSHTSHIPHQTYVAKQGISHSLPSGNNFDAPPSSDIRENIRPVDATSKSFGTRATPSATTKHSASQEVDEDHFSTPEESIENIAAKVSAGSTMVDSGLGAGGSAMRHYATASERDIPSYRAADVNLHSTNDHIGKTDQTTNQNAELPDVPVEDSKDYLSVQRAPTFIADPPQSTSLGPTVRSRKEYFEDKQAEVNDVMTSRAPAQLRKAQSYAIDKTSAAVHKSGDLDEFVAADLKRFSSTAAEVGDTYVQDPLGVPVDSLPVSTENEAPSNATTEDINTAPPDHETIVSKTVPLPVDDGGDPVLGNLRKLLSAYPSNPMRADSQSSLLKLLIAVQEFPVSNLDAYRIVDEGSGCFKVIVAMISQPDNEHIQEHGLHCFVRIMRSTSSSKRESISLMSYANCFRTVQGKADVVVPKGTVGVKENSSGAVQATVLAMRRHSSVRRIQLAGCAALSEILSASDSCRSAAYESGAVNPIVACLRHRSTAAAAVVHDMACRALANFCNGRENVIFKEAFTNAGAVSEILSILQLWGHSEEEMTELMMSATINCCGALRHLADGYSVASAQCIQSFAYHHLVRVMVLHRDNSAICTMVLSALTSITRSAGSSAERSLLDAKPLPEVLASMQIHSEDALFIRKALDFMEALGSFSTMKEDIVAAGGIPFATDITQQGGNDTLLLERACGVIEKLCRLSPPNQEIFATNNGVQYLTALLSSHERVPGVVERSLLALTSVCTNNVPNQREAVRAKSPEVLVRLLGVYSAKNGKVVSAAAGVMCALVVPKNISVAQTFAGLKAPELLVRAMKRHPDSVMVQENGSAAIAAFCEADPHIMTSLLKSGITTTLVVALQRFLHKQTAVVQIVRAMRAITNEVVPEDSYRFKSKLLTDRSNESSLPEIFHTALSYHKKSLPDTANVIISICATINRLCMRSVAFKNEVGKDGIVEELKRLVERTAEYKELGALQPVLATICTLVLESEENKNRFHAVGGVEAILDVMQKWKHDTYVLEHCCAALRYSCNDHFGNCDEVKNHNGVRSILGVMEMHPENVNVTLWCCLTLADLCKGDEELQSSATVVQGIRKVVSAMNMFSQNSRFLASACEFLRAASVCNEDNQERIVRLGGRSAIVNALETHPTDNTLTEAAAYALLQIQNIPDPRVSTDSMQAGGAKRFSKDLRRSGSSSNKSNRSSSKGNVFSKAHSFSTKRRNPDEAGAREYGEEEVDDTDQRQNIRPQKTSSLINLHRLIPRFRRHSQPDVADEPDEDVDVMEEPYEGDYDLEYDFNGAHHESR